MQVIPFQPTDGANVSISASTTSAEALVTNGTPQGRIQVRVANSGTAAVFIKFGSSTSVVATSADAPVLASSVAIFSVDCPANGTLYAAALAATGTATVYLQPGVGIS